MFGDFVLGRGDRDELERGDVTPADFGVPMPIRGESNEIISAKLTGPEFASTLLMILSPAAMSAQQKSKSAKDRYTTCGQTDS